jgi:hypothetical protein
MRVRVLLTALLALALAGPAAARADAPASVHVSSCKTGSQPKQRSATYKAWMRSVPDSVRMGMHFKLVVHQAGQKSASALSDPKLSVWHRSHRGVTRYVYSQTVKKLSPGSSYRTLVKFRWYDANGNVIKRAKRRSGACVQNGALPNLMVSAVSVSPGPSAGTAVYGVSIGNTGEVAALGFSVGLFADGALADSRTIDQLGPGESTTIELNGPTCTRLSAVVDREHAVPETVEDDNTLHSRC